MDPAQLVAACTACQSPDPAIRKAAEDALNQVCASRFPAASGGGMPCRRRRLLVRLLAHEPPLVARACLPRPARRPSMRADRW